MKNSKARPYFQAFYQNNRLRWALSLLLMLLAVPFQLYVSWMLGAVLDIAASGELSALWRVLRLSLALTTFFLAVQLAAERVRAACIHRALEQYKSLAFRRLSEKSLSAFSRESTGRYLSILTNDVNTVEENYLRRSLYIVYNAVMFLGALGMLLWYSPALTAVTVVLAALPLCASLLSGGVLAKREREVSDRNERFVSQTKDLLSGFSVLKSFKAEGEARRLFDRVNHDAEEAKRRRRWYGGLVETAASACGLVMQFGIFFAGAYLAIRGEITGGTVLVFVQMCNYLISPINIIPQYWASRKAAVGLVEKLAGLAEENAGRGGETIEPVLREAIELKGLCFAYEPGRPVLKDLTLRLEAGKSYALVGASGSGKSTLLSLLMGAYDSYEGSLTVDGRELRGIDPDSLYDLISLIGQSVFVFDDTVERNITLFRDFPADKVASAVERSGLADLLSRKGGDYRCGENGGNLSGGERQRVSIARCLLRNTPVLLLDEATASLDNETAFAVNGAILSLDGLTRLVVTHRLDRAILERYDAILVLRDGRLWEQGSFRELMDRKGYFYSLYTVSNGTGD